jgi:hypothetical protein
MDLNYNANLFELRTYKSLVVNVYTPKISPNPEKPAHFYQILGRIARKLTKDLRTAVISDRGKIKVLESQIDGNKLETTIELENIDSFEVKLSFEETNKVRFAESPEEYKRLVSRIVDLALVYLSDDYYKYYDYSPYIIERGEGYFDEVLRQRIGVEDGRRFYRGLKIVDGVPHLIINREIELRSWKNLLNELKILAESWNAKNAEIDFYNPSDDFINFVNRIFRNRTANVKAYSGRSIVIREITWDVRAKDKVLEGGLSPWEYHKQTHGIIISDEEQPLVKWRKRTDNGSFEEFYHVPELLVVGHNFKDISRRVPKSHRSQVFDILHPNCGDQQRRILDFVKKVDGILREKFSIIYPSKLEFSTFPKDVGKNITPPNSIRLKFKNKEIEITPPYGINFYKRYSQKIKFVKPIQGDVKALAICKSENQSFMEDVIEEIELRNDCNVELSFSDKLEPDDISEYDFILTVSDDGKFIEQCKKVIVNDLGIAHQNITPEKTIVPAIPQLAMQITLKLGGYPWFLAEPEEVDVLTTYSYRNPFTGTRFYLYNVMRPEGEITYQSKPFDRDRVLDFLREIGKNSKRYERLLMLTSFDDQRIQEFIMKEVFPEISEFLLIQIDQNDELRIFQTYKPTHGTRRRRRTLSSYPIEAYEAAPEGVILKTARNEYYLATTASTKVNTYHRGCPTPIRLRILESKGPFDMGKILQYVLSLSLASATSGHETRLPAPMYYLKRYANYISNYGVPKNEKVFEKLFYV